MNRLSDRLPLLQFYVTAAYPCNYLPGQMARSQVAMPRESISEDLYSQLVRAGFRRSGLFTYRPHCDQCHACTPARVPVDLFEPNRAQRRVRQRHDLLEHKVLAPLFRDEHYALYLRYQRARHPDGGMDGDDQEQYRSFLLQSFVPTQLIEFREQGVLRMVSVIDRLEDGLSSVYTFFDPAIARASYGTYSILWQIELCRRLGLPYLYLGYWVKDSPKMAYKINFQPLEALIEGEWQRLVK